MTHILRDRDVTESSTLHPRPGLGSSGADSGCIWGQEAIIISANIAPTDTALQLQARVFPSDDLANPLQFPMR